MRKLAIGLITPSILLLTACPGPDDPEDVDVPPAAERVNLEELQGSGLTGEVAVTPRENETHFVINLTNAPANETLDVRLHSGTCQSPGPEIRNIGTIRTGDDGRGAIETTVGEAPGLIMDGMHIAVVWAPLDRDMDRDVTDPATTQPGTDPAATPGAAPPTGQTDQQAQPGVDQMDTGLIRNDRRAVACTTLPRS